MKLFATAIEIDIHSPKTDNKTSIRLSESQKNFSPFTLFCIAAQCRRRCSTPLYPNGARLQHHNRGCYGARQPRPNSARGSSAFHRTQWLPPCVSSAAASSWSAPGARTDWDPSGARVGRGAGALGARGAKKRRPRLGRGALQNIGGAEIQNHFSRCRCQTRNLELCG